MVTAFVARALVARFLLLMPCDDPIMASLFSKQLTMSLD
jgi:hypothetical protein